MIHSDRINPLNSKPIAPREFVVYWMQASQRTKYNHALEYAIVEANRLNKPLIVYFGITDNYPGANLRHYSFMIEGLQETARALEKRGIQCLMVHAEPPVGIRELAQRAALIVTDFGYTRIQRQWRETVAAESACAVVAIESDVLVPVQSVCPKEAWSAAVIRRRITPLLREYLAPLPEARLKKKSTGVQIDVKGRVEPDLILDRLEIDRTVGAIASTRGGYTSAQNTLKRFVEHNLSRFGDDRNDPNAGATSGLSLYLHFGQVSPIEIALAVKEASPRHSSEYLEELIVRRELSMNFCWYNSDYDRHACLPSWAKATLEKHARDKREYLYSRSAWESADTHDRYWNAAQKELLLTGRIHGYMRMYWGKKILEWSKSPEEAYDTGVYLNDKYALDGRDPNGYAGVAWCFGKHDRPWAERPVFGMVRYMNEAGLRRKFVADAYVKRIKSLEK